MLRFTPALQCCGSLSVLPAFVTRKAKGRPELFAVYLSGQKYRGSREMATETFGRSVNCPLNRVEVDPFLMHFP
jgi:hypothetical protein